MASQAQLEANRANAKKSTGPKTPPGKQRASMNALRHGLTGQITALTAEDRAAFDAHCTGIRASLAPVGALELDLAQSIAEDRWRLRRARAIEANLFALGHCGEAGNIEAPNLEIAAAMGQARTWLADGKSLQLLTLYEQRIQRAVDRNMAELRTLQSERRAFELQALEEAQLLAKLAAMNGERYDPREDCPEFPVPGIAIPDAALVNRLLERNNRLNHARFHEKRGWDTVHQYTEPAWNLSPSELRRQYDENRRATLQ